MHVTLTTILYQPDWSRTGPIIEENLAALDACDLQGELLIVDNSQTPTVPALELAARDDRVRLLWNDGYNLYIAGALNRVLPAARGRNVVYFCASHGRANDPTWLTDLLAPLEDPQVGAAGCVLPCEFNRVAACPADLIEPQLHVQGGIWSARLEALRSIGFSHRFPFEFCDVDLSRRLLAAGFRLANVPSIVSVAGGQVPHPERNKYVHDYR
jgi:GT2 family glycosyltransferase